MSLILMATPIIYIIACIAQVNKNKKTGKLNVISIICLLSIAIILTTISGLRDGLGDTEVYITRFKLLPLNLSDAFLYWEKEKGFILIMYLVKKYIMDNAQMFIFLSAAVVNASIVFVISKYSKMMELSFFLYIMMGTYISTMNGLRQYIAIIIVFLGTKLIIEKKLKLFIILIVIASLFHKSAFVLIPVYAFVNMKTWSKPMWGSLIGIIIFTLFFNSLAPAILSILGATTYEGYTETLLVQGNGANFLRVIVIAVPLIIAFINKNRLRDRTDTVIINMCILELMFCILSTRNWMFARIGAYFGIYSILLLPLVMKKGLDKKIAPIIYALCIILYGLYGYFNMSLSSAIYTSQILGIN